MISYRSVLLGFLIADVASGAAKAQEAISRQGCPLEPPALREPVVDVRQRGAAGDGITDDTDAINAAIASLKAGGTIQLAPGIYRHDRPIRIERADVTVIGRAATLYAGNPDQAAVFVSGDRSGLYDVAITARDADQRGDQPETAGLVVSGAGNAIVDVKISKSKSAGMLLLGARDFTVACSDVFNTKADGIHMTKGSQRGRVAFNSVWNSEDDGIAVVSYEVDPLSSDIVIEDNTIEHIRWGRGIGIIGASKVLVRRNKIRSVAMAAGIIVAREAFWKTQGTKDVVIEDNAIFDVQRTLQPLKPNSRTGQAGIDINSDDAAAASQIADVTIRANMVTGTGRDGIRLNGNVTRVTISGNSIDDVLRDAIEIVHAPAEQQVDCHGNRGDGQRAPCQP